ncbi:MAG: rRNA maturation RNase YbeY [Chitinophagaceae bacterium]|nr:rRNA maturation RNase YbeY [Chitinophagaceae bacterium]
MLPIQFFYNDVQPNIKDRTKLRLFIVQIFKREHKPLQSLTYVFCTDDYLLSINKSFLKHNFFTDIITFELSDKNEPCKGEVYISIDRVRENAENLGCSFKEEIHRVVFHGALHLCGYKDKTSAEQRDMRAAEDKYLNLYFINI